MRTLLLLSAVVVLTTTLVGSATSTSVSPAAEVDNNSDHCNNFDNCATCVASPFCGWCSNKVNDKNGAPGHHCAGFNKNTTNPFICYGMYSTKTCARGWQCDLKKGSQCEQTAPPGGGTSEAMCNANCSTVGKTYTCDETSYTCKVAGAGHGTSFAVCNSSCHAATSAPSSHQSHAPSSHHPSSAHPASPHPASPHPNTPHTPAPTPTQVTPTYLCNTTTLTCEKAALGHSGTSKTVCGQDCKQSSHIPAALQGIWRFFPISFNGNLDGNVAEEDFEISSNGSAVFVARDSKITAVATSVGGNSIGDGVTEIHFTYPAPTPMVICLFKPDLPLPETQQMMMACSWTGTPPQSFHAAMNTTKQTVLLAAKCVDSAVNCTFTLGPQKTGSQQLDALSESSGGRSMLRLSDNNRRGTAALEGLVATPPTPPVSDPCEAQSTNCSVCLAHPDCGWCSTNVVYTGGQVGKRCAGFNPNGGKNPFTCSGSYSTEECVTGYACDAATQQCALAGSGMGVPKEACDASCKARPGPPTELVGKWRGLLIQNGYKFGVVTVDMSNGDNVTINIPPHSGPTAPGASYTATIKHVGGEVFLTYTSGPMSGSHIVGIFTIQYGELATTIDIAFGGANEAAPTSYPAAMVAPNTQLLLAKCMDAGCTW